MMDRNLFVSRLEEKAFEEMMKVIAFDDEAVYLYKNYDEKLKRPDLLGKTLRVSRNQCSDVFFTVEELSSSAGIEAPEVFIYEDFYYGVEARGIEKPWIEISAKTITDFTKDELRFLLAREICNIALGHTKTGISCQEILGAMGENNLFPGMDALAQSWKIAMYRWSRAANYTADCYGYLMTKMLKPCTQAILKMILNNCFLAGNTNMNEYIKQGEAINELDNSVHNFTKLDEMVPYGPFRIKNLIAYASSERGLRALKEMEGYK